MEFEIKNNTIYITAKNEILRYKSNRICTRYIWRKPQIFLMKEINQGLNKWRNIPCLWRGRLNIVKISVLLSLIYRFNAIPIKIPGRYLVDINKLTLKFLQRGKRPRMANTILKEKNKVGWLTLSNFKTYYKAAVIKTAWYWQKNRQTDQWNKIESP